MLRKTPDLSKGLSGMVWPVHRTVYHCPVSEFSTRLRTAVQYLYSNSAVQHTTARHLGAVVLVRRAGPGRPPQSHGTWSAPPHRKLRRVSLPEALQRGLGTAPGDAPERQGHLQGEEGKERGKGQEGGRGEKGATWMRGHRGRQYGRASETTGSSISGVPSRGTPEGSGTAPRAPSAGAPCREEGKGGGGGGGGGGRGRKGEARGDPGRGRGGRWARRHRGRQYGKGFDEQALRSGSTFWVSTLGLAT